MSVEISTLTPSLKLGEGPHWDDVTQALYFVDIYGSTIHKYDPASEKHTYTKVHIPGQSEKPVSLIIPVKGEPNKFVISHGIDVALISWDGENGISNYQVLASATEEPAGTRINDGKVSPSGVLFAGTMATSIEQVYEVRGNFYSFKNFQPKRLLTGIGISNGLAWNDDEKIFYYIDSLNYAVEAFDYDAETAGISNRRTIFVLPDNDIDAFPDGMTIDTDGNLWVACYGGSRVVKINPKTGSLLSSISLPAVNITSVAFGGKNLDELYVTSAQPEKPTQNQNDPMAGCTFRIRGTGSTGRPAIPIDLHSLSK